MPLEAVQASFERYGLLDERARFHRGYFRDSLPPLREEFQSKGGAIALLRPRHMLPTPFSLCCWAWQQSRPLSTVQLRQVALFRNACHATCLEGASPPRGLED